MYNGHKDRGHWNVALWIGNDEPLYRLALECLEGENTTHKAAKRLRVYLGGPGAKTPDRFEYTQERVSAALRGLV